MVEGDPRASEPSTAAEVSGETVEHALRSAFDLYGPDMLYAAERLRIFLTDRCPAAESDIALVMAGLDEQVPQALLSAHTADELKSLLPRLQARLTDQRSLNRYAAAWSVTTWADALRLRPEAGGWKHLRRRTTIRRTGSHAHAGTPAASLAAVGASIPSGADAPAPTTDASTASVPADAAGIALSPAIADPLWAVGPTAAGAGPAPWYSDDAEAADGARDSEPLATARSISVWYGIGAAIVAIAVVVFAIRYQANRSASEAVVATAAPSARAGSRDGRARRRTDRAARSARHVDNVLDARGVRAITERRTIDERADRRRSSDNPDDDRRARGHRAADADRGCPSAANRWSVTASSGRCT